MIPHRLLLAIWLPTLVLVLPSSLHAHPISLSAALVDVRPDKITAEVKILAEDLVLYHSLAADGKLNFKAEDLRKAAEKHRKLLLKWFTIRDVEGNPLVGKITDHDTSEIPDEGIQQSDLMKRTLSYLFEFPLKERPEFLTLTQNFGGANSLLPAQMDCMVLQNGNLLFQSKQLLANRPFSMRIDWDNPPKAKQSWRELRAKKLELFQQRLGISSYGGVYSFIYITNHEVRHEILIPLLTLESWIKIPRKDPDFLDVPEQEAAREYISDFFAQRNAVRIDGIKVKPVLQRLSFFGLDINDFALNAKPRRVGVHQARVGVILSFSTKGAPQKVQMQWDMYSELTRSLRSKILAFDESPADHVFITDSQTYLWQRESAEEGPPAVAAIKTQSRRPSETQAQSITNSLVKNVYRAFDYQKDSDIYDALAHSARGDLLRKLYLQFKQSLLMAEQGGARSRVRDVKMTDGELVQAARDKFQFRCRWQVTGTVEHWGHVHTRINEYAATFTVIAQDDAWKISSYRFEDQKRVRFETSLRTFK